MCHKNNKSYACVARLRIRKGKPKMKSSNTKAFWLNNTFVKSIKKRKKTT
jgi:hypothetical protein